MRLSFHQPVGALGLVLVFGITASVLSSAAAARLLARLGPGLVVAAATLLVALALGEESAAPSLSLFTAGAVVFGVGSGALDAALNAYAARRFGPRQVNWMHASLRPGRLPRPAAGHRAARRRPQLAVGVRGPWPSSKQALALAARS